jgi:hypothetical protein
MKTAVTKANGGIYDHASRIVERVMLQDRESFVPKVVAARPRSDFGYEDKP